MLVTIIIIIIMNFNSNFNFNVGIEIIQSIIYILTSIKDSNIFNRKIDKLYSLDEVHIKSSTLIGHINLLSRKLSKKVLDGLNKRHKKGSDSKVRRESIVKGLVKNHRNNKDKRNEAEAGAKGSIELNETNSYRKASHSINGQYWEPPYKYNEDELNNFIVSRNPISSDFAKVDIVNIGKLSPSFEVNSTYSNSNYILNTKSSYIPTISSTFKATSNSKPRYEKGEFSEDIKDKVNISYKKSIVCLLIIRDIDTEREDKLKRDMLALGAKLIIVDDFEEALRIGRLEDIDLILCLLGLSSGQWQYFRTYKYINKDYVYINNNSSLIGNNVYKLLYRDIRDLELAVSILVSNVAVRYKSNYVDKHDKNDKHRGLDYRNLEEEKEKQEQEQEKVLNSSSISLLESHTYNPNEKAFSNNRESVNSDLYLFGLKSYIKHLKLLKETCTFNGVLPAYNIYPYINPLELQVNFAKHKVNNANPNSSNDIWFIGDICTNTYIYEESDNRIITKTIGKKYKYRNLSNIKDFSSSDVIDIRNGVYWPFISQHINNKASDERLDKSEKDISSIDELIYDNIKSLLRISDDALVVLNSDKEVILINAAGENYVYSRNNKYYFKKEYKCLFDFITESDNRESYCNQIEEGSTDKDEKDIKIVETPYDIPSKVNEEELSEDNLINIITLYTRRQENIDISNHIRCNDKEFKGYAVIFNSSSSFIERYRINSLTSLPNWTWLERDMCNLFGNKVSLLLLSIKRFKLYSDNYGRSIGDKLIKELAGRLKLICDFNKDRIKLLHIESNEFAFILLDHEDQEIQNIIDKILAITEVPFLIKVNDSRYQVYLECNIGTSHLDTQYCVKKDDNTKNGPEQCFKEYIKFSEKLLSEASLALNESKKENLQVVNYTQRISDKLNILLTEEARINNIVKSDDEQIEVLFQPIVDVSTRQMIYVEALMRYTILDEENNKSLRLSEEFIQVGEQTGMIIYLDLEVMKKAFKLIGNLNKKRMEKGYKPIGLNINVSGNHFLTNSNARQLTDNITRYWNKELIPNLGIEVTESIAIDNLSHCKLFLTALRDMGLKIYLDDFGMKYSSLCYVSQLPIDVLKIDRKFIKEFDLDKKSIRFIKAIIGLAHTLYLDVVAEGVDSTSQLDLLQELGCNDIQGYIFSKPIAIPKEWEDEDKIEFDIAKRS